MRVVSTLLAVAFCFTAGTVSAEPARKALPPTIAIIIDDMGHSLVEGERLANLDQPPTSSTRKSCCTPPWPTPATMAWVRAA